MPHQRWLRICLGFALSLAVGDATRAQQAAKSATDEFAARRMNKSIRRALAGRKLDDV